MRAALVSALLLLAACAGGPETVATDVQTVDKPVAVVCKIAWPKKPTPHVANVQRSGRPLEDLVTIWRAAEAELEERIAYELELDAAARNCVEAR